jgi:adenosine deaminase
MDLTTFLKEIPKVELHCHLAGTLRPHTFIELAEKHSITLPTYREVEEVYAYKSFPEFLEITTLVDHAIRSLEDFQRVTYEALEQLSGCGVRYAELFWNPGEHLEMGVPFQTQIRGLILGIEDAEADFGIQGRIIAAINREKNPEIAIELVHLMIENHHPLLIGLGMDYNDVGNPPEKFWKAYRLAHEAGFRRTAHACEESTPPRDIETCLDLLGCERIDHGYGVLKDDALLKRCVEEGVHFTVVPSVFYDELLWDDFEQLDKQTLKRMAAHGLNLILGSDDPAVFKADLLQAYTLAMTHLEFSLSVIKELMLNGIDAAWMDVGLKDRFRREWTEEFNEKLALVLDGVEQ